MPKRLSNRERLAQHMDARRLQLDLRWADVATAARVTTETLRQARVGPGEIRPLTRRGIERALWWESGSVNAVLAGGEPTPLEVGSLPTKVSPRPPLRSLPAPKRQELHERIDQLPDDQLARALDVLAAVFG